MRDVHAAVECTLHHREDLGASASASQSHVEYSHEWIRVVVHTLRVVVLASGLLHTLVGLIQLNLLQPTSSQQQSSGVCSRVVRKTNLQLTNN